MFPDPDNKKLVEATDNYHDNFFSASKPIGSSTGLWVVFLQQENDAFVLQQFLETDFLNMAEYVDAGAFNGHGRRGFFVRFKPSIRTVSEVHTFLSSL